MNIYKPIEINHKDVTVEHLYDFLLTIKEFVEFDNINQQLHFIKPITEHETYTVCFDMEHMGFYRCCLLGLFIKLNNLPEPDKTDVKTVSEYFERVPEGLLHFVFFTYTDTNKHDFPYHLNRSLTFLKFYIHENNLH